jgi:hypothetical protein
MQGVLFSENVQNSLDTIFHGCNSVGLTALEHGGARGFLTPINYIGSLDFQKVGLR